MNRFPALLASLLLSMASAMLAVDLHAKAGPAEIVAHYKIYKSGILIGTVEEKFIREGDTYKVVSETQTAGALKWLLRDRVTLSAEGRIGAKGLEPASYQLKRQNDQSKNISATFERDKSKIISHHHNKTETFDLPPGTVDRISAMYQFAFDAPLTPEVTFWMSQGKEAEQYRYRKRGEPVIKVGDATFPTVHYVRDSAPGRPQAQLWLAKNRYFLPVRMIFEDSHGLELEQTLVDLQTQ